MIHGLQRFQNAGAPPLMRSLMEVGSAGELRGLIGELRAATPLPEDAQRVIDQAVVDVGVERLVVAQDLLTDGLAFPLTDAMSVMEVQWEVRSKTGGAQRTMHPSARGENQLPDRLPRRIPVYLTTDDFHLGIRTLLASQRVNAPLDLSMVQDATRRVNEGIEDAAINGTAVQVDGNTTPGVLNAPNVNTHTYAGSEAWDAAGKTGQEIVDDVLAMIDLAQADRRYGPYNLYVNTTYGNALNKNFSDGVTTFPITIREQLEKIEAGGRTIRVRVADQMPTNRTALIQMTSDVIDIINGQAPTVVPFTSPDGMTLHWMVLAIQVPRVRDDYDGGSGIVTGNV